MLRAVRYAARLVSTACLVISGLKAIEWMRMSMPPCEACTAFISPSIE